MDEAEACPFCGIPIVYVESARAPDEGYRVICSLCDVSEVVPPECNCPARTCQPANNIGKVCWRSGFDIRASDFPPAVSMESHA